MGQHQDREWDAAANPVRPDAPKTEEEEAQALLISEGQFLVGILVIGFCCLLAMIYTGGKHVMKRIRRPLAGSALDLDDMPG